MSAKPGKAPIPSADRRLRRHPRYSCNFPLTVTLFAGDRYRHLGAHCKNLSKAGMGVLLSEELPLGDVVSLSFTFPGSPQVLEVRAVLRHRRGYHYGLEFISLSKEQIRTILRFLQDLKHCE